MIRGIINHNVDTVRTAAIGLECMRKYVQNNDIPVDIFNIAVAMYVELVTAAILTAYEKYIYDYIIAQFYATGHTSIPIAFVDNRKYIVDRVRNYGQCYNYSLQFLGTRAIFIGINSIALSYCNLPVVAELIASWRPRICVNSTAKYIRFDSWAD